MNRCNVSMKVFLDLERDCVQKMFCSYISLHCFRKGTHITNASTRPRAKCFFVPQNTLYGSHVAGVIFTKKAVTSNE